MLLILLLVPVTAVVSVMVDRTMRGSSEAVRPPPARVGPLSRHPVLERRPNHRRSPNRRKSNRPAKTRPPLGIRTRARALGVSEHRPKKDLRVRHGRPPRDAAPFDAQQRIRSLSRRARALAEQHPALAMKTNQLIADVSMWAALSGRSADPQGPQRGRSGV